MSGLNRKKKYNLQPAKPKPFGISVDMHNVLVVLLVILAIIWFVS